MRVTLMIVTVAVTLIVIYLLVQGISMEINVGDISIASGYTPTKPYSSNLVIYSDSHVVDRQLYGVPLLNVLDLYLHVGAKDGAVEICGIEIPIINEDIRLYVRLTPGLSAWLTLDGLSEKPAPIEVKAQPYSNIGSELDIVIKLCDGSIYYARVTVR